MQTITHLIETNTYDDNISADGKWYVTIRNKGPANIEDYVQGPSSKIANRNHPAMSATGFLGPPATHPQPESTLGFQGNYKVQSGKKEADRKPLKPHIVAENT